MDFELLKSLATALFIGALVGTEREHRQMEEQEGFAGLRTFILVAELGALAAWVSQRLSSPGVLIAGLLGVSLLAVTAYALQRQQKEAGAGITTEVAAVVTYVLGAVAVIGEPPLAVALGIVTAALLATKTVLHTAVSRIRREELFATLRLLFASFVVLPLLPSEPVDPWGALNPYKLWLLVVLISALSMVGYVAVRLFGSDRGTLLTGFFGGLVSSTAVTLNFARQSREPGAALGAIASATLVAWTVMFGRVLVLVGALSWPLLRPAVVPLGMMALAAMIAGSIALFRGGGQMERGSVLELKNPFRLLSAVKFAALFALVLVVARLAQLYLPEVGLQWVSAIAGSTDVDAVALSLLELASRTEIASRVVVQGLVLASITNTLMKLGLIALLGNRGLAWRLVLPTAAVVAAGCVALVLAV